jgi:hypothetical protein
MKGDRRQNQALGGLKCPAVARYPLRKQNIRRKSRKTRLRKCSIHLFYVSVLGTLLRFVYNLFDCSWKQKKIHQIEK